VSEAHRGARQARRLLVSVRVGWWRAALVGPDGFKVTTEQRGSGDRAGVAVPASAACTSPQGDTQAVSMRRRALEPAHTW
jgi:hypothetical protein